MAAQSLSATAIIRPEYNRFNPNKPTQNTLTPHKILHSQWLGAISRSNLSFQSSNLRPFLTKRPAPPETTNDLPYVNPDRVGDAEKIPTWSLKAIKVFTMSELEARKIRVPETDTEALLMGILNEGTNLASQFLRAIGITLTKVRAEILKMRGEPNIMYMSPMHPPLTEATQKALNWAVDEKLKSGGNGEITTTHILLGVWHQEEAPGHQILAALGFNDEKAEVLHSLISRPEFVEL